MQRYRTNRHELTKDQYDILIGSGDWDINEVPIDEWSNLPAWMTKDCLAINASGSMNNAKMMHGLKVIGGIDWLRAENNPKSGEPDGNAYHFVITASGQHNYSYGPFQSGTLVPHWFTEEDLNNY